VRGWRLRRYQLFVTLCELKPDERILDVGAGAGGALERFNQTNPIVALDVSPPPPGTWLDAENVTIVTVDADADRLPFDDGAFPVVFCSSMIQYVPAERRSALADELRRVSERYFVQTPNRRFPIDPHYQVPFIQFLPRRARRWLTNRLTLGWRTRGDDAAFEMLTRKEIASLFPDAEIHSERVLGLTKSFMVVRRAS
jgi:SAM-dependent methyltransferase